MKCPSSIRKNIKNQGAQKIMHKNGKNVLYDWLPNKKNISFKVFIHQLAQQMTLFNA